MSEPANFEPIVVSAESTVVAEFVPDSASATSYQSEADLERELIGLLRGQAYDYLTVTSEDTLVANLRTQLEAINAITFTDAEWERFFTTSIAGANDGIVEKTVRIQTDHVQVLKRDDGTIKNVHLIDKTNIHNNRLQVINQYEVGAGVGGGKHANRYDVTILVNGLPLVHVELKRRGVDIREAFNQIDRYQRDSFWAGSGLFEYVQLFVISNGTLTKYYSNTTRRAHLDERSGTRRAKRTSNSFEFTSWWADATNKPIRDLVGFTKTFFAKHALLNILTKYCVLTADRLLLVMRPYQIVATERILQKINVSTSYHRLGTLEAGGYVWHTTGSGKTLTSFKSAQLASRVPGVDKVLFVVDRKDLDYQTMREYDRFEKGAANSNTSTAVLKRQLEDPGVSIIITTIQKLANFINTHKGHAIYDGHVVIVFDECHRSQFGDMHAAITKAFRRYHLFGFTGTPIFTVNAARAGNPQLRTTPQTFGCFLHGDPRSCPPEQHQMAIHTYTIVDAISDKNVLPFRIDYVNTIKAPDGIDDKQVPAIDTERALLAPERVAQVTSYVLEHFDQKTRRASGYEMPVITNIAEVVGGRNKVRELKRAARVKGFNALMATASIDAAKRYYLEFTKQQAELNPGRQLRVATIFSYAANEEVGGDYLDEEHFETDRLDQASRDFLEHAIGDYNAMFGTSYDTSAEKFQNYYKDVSLRLKNRELDLLIVVNMFLTGFDATTLNTLFVDKRLVNHGLLQAYSRTNRILNAVKTYGNIVSFRDLEQETNDAIALFGNKEARGIVLLKPYADYHTEYADRVTQLLDQFPLGEDIVGEAAQKSFIALYGTILRLANILTSFDEFTGQEILTNRQSQDYRSIYLNLYRDFRQQADADKESIVDDVVFEIELIKQVEVNVDFILMLVQQWREARGDGSDREMEAVLTIERAVDSSLTLRNKRDLIMDFVDRVSASGDLDEEWRTFVEERRTEELDAIIAEEDLKPEPTRDFVDQALRDGAIPTGGTAIIRILPPVSRFGAADGHGHKKSRVLGRLQEFFDRFFDLGAVPKAD
ncbi:type I restriction endonuclease subunit R [Nocardioides rotundus]|uniref:type I restriction endonuclease subunit R n=1 Tax=Nocardioides rotundus TaxID=1774216 RepID=UPI001CC04771|nr:type I restriction endonuclease subunit R [Nocardioides rotundus]UAL30160.1 type I restriction endonuclease subunit R [Nocardioides rotundus]